MSHVTDASSHAALPDRDTRSSDWQRRLPNAADVCFLLHPIIYPRLGNSAHDIDINNKETTRMERQASEYHCVRTFDRHCCTGLIPHSNDVET